MPLIGRYRSDRLVGIHAFSAARIGNALRNPSKQQLRDELADVVRNTAKLQAAEPSSSATEDET